MTAITAAAVSHTITRNCSQGGIQVMLMLMTAMAMTMVMVMTAMMMVMLSIIIYVQHCECEPRYGRRRRTAWQWGGCSDNVYFGDQVIFGDEQNGDCDESDLTVIRAEESAVAQ